MKTCMQRAGAITKADCMATATHKILDYFLKGKDRSLYFCAEHAALFKKLHFGAQPIALNTLQK